MICLEIIEKYLRDNGLDGLVHRDSQCGCTLSDLVACGDYCGVCEPASNAQIVSALCAGIPEHPNPNQENK